MQKTILLTLTAICLILFAGTQTHTQGQTQIQDFVPNSRTTNPADDCLLTAQRLEKTLDVLEATETVLKSKESEIAALKRLDEANKALLNAKDAMLLSKDEELAILRKVKCSETKLFWGIYKRKNCF